MSNDDWIHDDYMLQRWPLGWCLSPLSSAAGHMRSLFGTILIMILM